MYVDIAGQVAEPDGQPPGEGDQQARGDQHDTERDEQAAEGHDSSIGTSANRLDAELKIALYWTVRRSDVYGEPW